MGLCLNRPAAAVAHQDDSDSDLDEAEADYWLPPGSVYGSWRLREKPDLESEVVGVVGRLDDPQKLLVVTEGGGAVAEGLVGDAERARRLRLALGVGRQLGDLGLGRYFSSSTQVAHSLGNSTFYPFDLLLVAERRILDLVKI